MKMMKCHITGIFLNRENAYVLDISRMRRAIQELKNKTLLFEKLIDDFGRFDNVEVNDEKKGKVKMIRQKRLICDNLAIAYNKMYFGHEIFISWKEFLTRNTKK
jgi:hypothetical protein